MSPASSRCWRSTASTRGAPPRSRSRCWSAASWLPSAKELDSDLRAMAAAKGWGDRVIDMVKQILICGDADTVGERLGELAASGVTGLVCNLPVNGHVPGRISLMAEVADRALTAGR